MRSYWEILAEHLQENPASVTKALDTLDSWMARGQGAQDRLLQWKKYLLNARDTPQGMAVLLDLLLSSREEDVRLRDFHPFAGILTREQRRQAAELCTYRH